MQTLKFLFVISTAFPQSFHCYPDLPTNHQSLKIHPANFFPLRNLARCHSKQLQRIFLPHSNLRTFSFHVFGIAVDSEQFVRSPLACNLFFYSCRCRKLFPTTSVGAGGSSGNYTRYINFFLPFILLKWNGNGIVCMQADHSVALMPSMQKVFMCRASLFVSVKVKYGLHLMNSRSLSCRVALRKVFHYRLRWFTRNPSKNNFLE